MNNLASSYLDLGHHQKAMHLVEQTLELQERVLGKEHPDTATILIDSSFTSYFPRGEHQKVMHLYERTLNLRNHILVEMHPDTLRSKRYLAQLHAIYPARPTGT